MEPKNSLKKSVGAHFNKSKIFLLHFYNAYNVNLWEKNLDRSTAYSCRTNVFHQSFIIGFHQFMKKDKIQLKTKQLKQNIFKSMGVYGFSQKIFGQLPSVRMKHFGNCSDNHDLEKLISNNFNEKHLLLSGMHLAGESRGSVPLPFFGTIQIVPSNS